MNPVIVFGTPPSSYVRTTRMTCIEKGISHTFEPLAFGSDEIRRLHPFGRVPAMKHGELELFETSAICRYIDEVGGDPSLIPTTPAARARMEQWISAVNSYVYPAVVRDYALEYVFPIFTGQPVDRAKVEAGLANMTYALEQLDGAYEGREWVAGGFSLADLFVGPIVVTAGLFPEAQKVLAERGKNLTRLVTQLRARKSAEFLDPRLPPTSSG